MSEPILLNELSPSGVRTLTMNRPERRNALSSALVQALHEAFVAIRSDDTTRVVILTGAGDRAIAMHEARLKFVELLLAMQECGRPIIARLAGHAIAGGLGLVAACDLAIAADHARIGTPEIERGLFPMMIMALISRSIGRKRALKLLLTGQQFSATEAADWGLINDAVSADRLDEEVINLAERLASFSPLVMRLVRQAFYQMEDMELTQALNYLAGQLTVNTLSEDTTEGIMAWMQKRAPDWKGR